MPTIAKKEEVVKEITNNAQRAKSIIFYNFQHVDNENIFSLKKELKENDCLLKVYKNSLAERALSDKVHDLSLIGANALIFCFKDEYQPLKILNKFDQEQHVSNKINGGFYEQKFVPGSTLEKWAKLPTKRQLLQNFCYLLQLNLRRFVDLLEKLKEKKNS